MRSRKKLNRETSLYEPIGTDREGNEIRLYDIIESSEPDAPDLMERQQDIRLLYEKLAAELTPRERTVLTLRYGLYNKEDYTQREIAAMLGISRSYVSRIEKGAIEKLRVHFS